RGVRRARGAPPSTRPRGAGGGSVAAAAKGRGGGGATYGSPGIGPAVTSSSAAASRTLRVTTNSPESPLHRSPSAGPNELRPRVGLSPTSPHMLAGPRIEPPPSLPWAAGTNPG